jgi:tRNA modification GTPase
LRALTNERAAQREAAIVAHVPGMTRAILDISLDIGGLPLVVADTAGLRDTTDEVEQIGIERFFRFILLIVKQK